MEVTRVFIKYFDESPTGEEVNDFIRTVEGENSNKNDFTVTNITVTSTTKLTKNNGEVVISPTVVLIVEASYEIL